MMINEVDSFAELPRTDDSDLEVGDVYRVLHEPIPSSTHSGLIASGTVLKFDGRAWVPLNGVETVQNESDGKKKDVNAVGGVRNEHPYDCACMECQRRVSVPDDAARPVGDGLINGHKIVYPYDGAFTGSGECSYCGAHDFDDPCLYVSSVSSIESAIKSTSINFGEELGRGMVVEHGAARIVRRHDIQAMDADADVLGRWMPRDFVTWYVALVLRITGSSGNGGVDDTIIPGVGRAYGGMGSQSSASSESLKLGSGKKDAKSQVLLRSEWASVVKEGVDRRLRKIGRELKNKLDDNPSLVNKSERRRCSGRCGKFGESDWVYCARCGGPMREVD